MPKFFSTLLSCCLLTVGVSLFLGPSLANPASTPPLPGEQATPLKEAEQLNQQGAQLQQQWNFLEANRLYRRALAIQEQAVGQNHPDVAQTLSNLANLYRDLDVLFDEQSPPFQGWQRNAKELEQLYQRALAIREQTLGTTHPATAQSLHDLAHFYAWYALDDTNQAEPLLQRAIAIREQTLGANHPATAQSLRSLAFLRQEAGLYERAIAIQTQTLGANHPETIHSLIGIALLYFNQHQEAAAQRLSPRLLNQLEQVAGPITPETLVQLRGLAERFLDFGNPEAGIQLNELALRLHEQHSKQEYSEVDRLRRRLAGLYQNQKNYQAAMRIYQRAIAIQRQLPNQPHPRVLNSLNRLSQLSLQQQDEAAATQFVDQAFTLWQQLGPRANALPEEDYLSLIANLSNLAERQYQQGNQPLANLLHQRLLQVRAALRDDARSPEPGSDGAETSVQERLLARRSRQDQLRQYRSFWISTLYSLAPQVYASKQQRPTLDWLNRVITDESTRLAEEFLVSTDEQKMAYYMGRLQDLTDLSISFHLQAHPHNAEAAALGMNAILQYKGRLLDASTDNLRRLRQQLPPAKQSLLEAFTRLRDRLATLQLEAAPNPARPTHQTLIKQLEQQFRALQNELDAELRPRDQLLLDELASVRSVLTDLQTWRPSSLTPEAQQAQIAQLEQQAQALEQALLQTSAAAQTDVQPITLQHIKPLLPPETALVEFILYRPFRPDRFTPVGDRPVGFRYAMLDELWGEPRYAAYILNTQGRLQALDLGEAATLNQQIEDFRQALGQRDPRIKKVARALDATLMQPIRQQLGNTRKLLLSPDSQLNLLPFAALVDEQNRYLVETYDINYLTSGRDLLRWQHPVRSQQPPVIIASPDYAQPGNPSAGPTIGQRPSGQQGGAKPGSPGNPDRSPNRRSSDLAGLQFGPLPGTADEAAAIALKLPQATVLTGTIATENALKQMRSPQMLHIATHGFFLTDLPALNSDSRGGHSPVRSDLNPTVTAEFRPPGQASKTPASNTEEALLRSGLALAGFNLRQSGAEDGVLTALEVAGLDLRGTQLVVLSACETGVGAVANGEGVYGLRRALVLAGAASQLISLWQVDDMGTKDLMVQYYDQLLAQAGRSEALRQTQLAFLKHPAYRHPYFWAAFIPSGDWRSLTP